MQAEIALPTPGEVLVTLTAAAASDTVERSFSGHTARMRNEPNAQTPLIGDSAPLSCYGFLPLKVMMG